MHLLVSIVNGCPILQIQDLFLLLFLLHIYKLRKEETGLPGLTVSCSPTLFSGSGPVGLPPVPWTEKKKQLKGRHFSSDAEVIAAAETWLDEQHYEFLFSGL